MLPRAQGCHDRILLIDDDELVANSLRDYLVRGGSVVDVAPEAVSAARLMSASSYDVIVVDPYLTGAVHEGETRLLLSIRSMQPNAAMIVLTGYASPELAQLAGREGATAVLTKPQPVPALSAFVVGASRSSVVVPADPE